MTDEKKGGDAEKTGEFGGNGVKQGGGAVKKFGKGIKEGVSEKRNKHNCL
ncbi:MAG: hypothetical protein V1726_05030 [Methanobacteriota archaeon]